MSTYSVTDISIESDTSIDEVYDTLEIFEDLGLVEVDSNSDTDLIGATMVCCQLNPEYLKNVVTGYVEHCPTSFHKGS